MVEMVKTSGIDIIDCGFADYESVLSRQFELRDKRYQGQIPDTILVLEHEPVITLGARESANKLLADEKTLAQKGIKLVRVRRGGGVTAHNRGQLVFYPIFDLRGRNLGINEYIRELESAGMKLLERLGVRSKRRNRFPGLWVGEKKIASIGVRVSKSITYHGMAINIQNDLSIFDLFVPCGIDDVEITSVLKETGKKQNMENVKETLVDVLRSHFGAASSRRLPEWLKRPLPIDAGFKKTERTIRGLGLETICDSANCPNRGQCWSRGTATVLILGNICTRNCGFCSVVSGRPEPPDATEPKRLAQMAKEMKLKYLVITSVNRDDLSDGGAGHFRDCIKTVRETCGDIKFEILTGDFKGCQEQAIEILADALPFVFAHNIEMVGSLYSKLRKGGDYNRSLRLLEMAQKRYSNTTIKSSIMLGLGESEPEVEQCLNDMRNAGCERITIGQYLKPSKDSFEVVEYLRPEKFEFWKQKALELGFSWVISSPFARSSYFAEQETAV